MARILVVDDDKDILKLTERVLNQSGHYVLMATDALGAMDIMNHTLVDVVISDANMPHYSGFDLVQTLRKNAKFRNTSIAMLTGLKERKDVEKALKAGVDDYIVKPLDPILFLQKIDALLTRKPPIDHPEIRFNQRLKGNEISVVRKASLLSISEVGAEMITNYPLEPEDFLDFAGPLFESIGIEAPPLKVLSCRPGPQSGDFTTQLVFVGASEACLQKLRRWIYSHGSLLKKASST